MSRRVRRQWGWFSVRQKETHNELELAPDKNKTGTVPLRIEPNTERTMGKQEVFAIIPVRYPFRGGRLWCAAHQQLCMIIGLILFVWWCVLLLDSVTVLVILNCNSVERAGST